MKRLVFAVLFLLLVSIPLPVQAYTTTLTVIGEGTHTGGTYTGGATNFTNMQSDDALTTTVSFGPASGYHEWQFSACPALTTISSVTLYENIIIPGYGAYIQSTVLIGGVNYTGAFTGSFSDTTWALGYTTWTTNPSTGLAWTTADINNARFGHSGGGASGYGYVTYAYLVISATNIPPTVTTSSATSIGATTATLNGSITNLGGAASADYEGFVWGTTSHPSITDNATPPNAYSDNWTSAGTFAVGSFTHALTGLTSSSTYYYRSFAHNIYGWSYGSEIIFQPIHTPSITAQAATLIATTTAKLNASITSDGGQPADVQFAYDNATHASWGDYAHFTTLVLNTYNTGDGASADITGLLGATTYYFRAQITNDSGTATSSELNFSTYNSVLEPSSITALSKATSMSLVWVKGTGSNSTLVRYKSGAYPTSTSDGILAYLGTGESKTVTGLVAGTTYYIRAWGFTGGVYSASYAQTLTTTVAYDSASQSTSDIVKPTSDSTWTQTPSASKTATIPVAGALVQGISDSYHQPINYVWYFIWMLFAVGVAIGVYIKGNFNIILAAGAFLGIIGVGVWWYSVVAGGIVIFLAIIAVGWALTGYRRTGG
jgi:hypothetical protein